MGVALLLALHLVSPLNPAYAGVVTPPITPCNIEIGDAPHLQKLIAGSRPNCREG